MPKGEKKVAPPGRKRGGGKIHRREAIGDWDGKAYVRLDLIDQGKDLHVYVREGHELSRLNIGDRIKIVSD